MWKHIVRLILRQRLFVLIFLGLSTAFMGYLALQIKMSYQMTQMLPDSDSTVIKYNEFKKLFGQDGSVLYLGIVDSEMHQLTHFDHWYNLTEAIQKVDGVQGTLSLSKAFELVKNDSLQKFEIKPIFKTKPQNQQELDSLYGKIHEMPFYKGILFNETGATVMAVTLDKEKINSNKRFELIDDIKKVVTQYEAESGIKVHYSGLPYIRTITSQKVKHELLLFTILTILLASIILLFFFKSFKAFFYPLIVIIASVLWIMGLIQLFGYEITILTGILPPLIIVLSVENSIFLINHYHHEYASHRQKTLALARTIRRVGGAMLLTNITTAIGFAAFIITRNTLLVEFGVIASLSIMMVFVLSITLIPIFFSYVSAPSPRHLKHLERKGVKSAILSLDKMVTSKRPMVYVSTLLLVAFGFVGMFQLKTTGNVVDDIPVKDALYQDMLFFEKEFKGILPFEIMIDTKKPKGVLKLATIKRISELQDTLATYDAFSKSLSVADVVKIAKQAYYNGDPEKYELLSSNEQAFVMSYLPKDMGQGKKTMMNSFVDSNLQVTRISVQMANLSSPEIRAIKEDLAPKINQIFDPEKYNVSLTGTSVVFLEGTDFLISNLLYSLLIAVILISGIMFLLFNSMRMVLIAMIPNLIPQLLTVALMGYFGIPLKPSTILIFSIALGISVDNTIHYLSRYRQNLKSTNWNLKLSVKQALKETAGSMIYSSIVLLVGFSIFIVSSFGGTQSLGKLIAFTLFTAMFANLVLLPSLLLTLDKRITTKAFREPYMQMMDEEDDINVDDLEFVEKDPNNSNLTT